MNRVKLHIGIDEIFAIEKELFENKTGRKSPYYSRNDKGETVHYAVCPQCDNPVQIVGLYKALPHTARPYGKHYLRDIEGLAQADPSAYCNCIYADKLRQHGKEDRLPHMSRSSETIFNAVFEHFDRIVYIWDKKLPIWASPTYARQVLEFFVINEGWLYPGITLNNLPWVLPYLPPSKSLNGRLIKEGSPLCDSIAQKCEHAALNPSKYKRGYVEVASKPGRYLNLMFCYMLHNRSVLPNGEPCETLTLSVTQRVDGHYEDVHKEVFEVDESYLLNLISKGGAEQRENVGRWAEMRRIAAEVAHCRSS